MRFLIEAHHPSDIHFWKRSIRILQERGHEVLLLARDRDVMTDLLKAYPWIRYEVISRIGERNRFPLIEFLQRQWGVARRILGFGPMAIASISGSYAHSALFCGVPNVIFSDSEAQDFNHFISHPFATRIYTPSCYTKWIGGRLKWLRYRGNHELAFLRSGLFEADPEGIEESLGAGLGAYVPIRLSAWNTLHDIGSSGIGQLLGDIVNSIVSAGLRPVIVAEENKVPPELVEYRSGLPASRYHDLLAFSAFVLTEGASTASEAACMGKYAVYVNPLSTGYLLHLESEYGLVTCCKEGSEAQGAVEAFLKEPISAAELERRRADLMEDTIDVSVFQARVLELEGGYRRSVL